MASTINCIVCPEKATYHGGHVHRGKKVITAGFCKKHFRITPRVSGCKGCYGEWKEEMGDDGFDYGMMYIDKDGFHKLDEEE